LAYPGTHLINVYASSEIFQARLKLVQLYQKQKSEMVENEASQLLSDLLVYKHRQPLPSEVRVFILGELVDLLYQTRFAVRNPAEVAKAIFLGDAENLSLEALEAFERQQLWDTWQDKQPKTIELSETVYGMQFTVDGNTIVFLSRRSSAIEVLSYIAGRLSDAATTVGVFDMQDTAVYGDSKTMSDAFLTLRPSRFFDQWKLCFFFRDATVFDTAASRQTTIYLWTGLLATVLVFAAGALAIRAVNHQIKMNRLKNDFIATVTHELKTPLASMRLLVDTLLEGRYENTKTATEYLQLVANENKRLTHLIDSFLTFSRMERNKQVFDFRPVPPAEIAHAAIEAMGAKFQSSSGFQPESQTVLHQKNGCTFSANIDTDLPAVNADKDGMVTVLVNLLDNAYKYTNSNKQIELKVYEQNGKICFAVNDNGIGLSPRVQRKIFNRFYQVDSRLSRRAEGCGLGLSIVKFIVDAHKGTIEVESRSGEGSVFTVKLPTL
jgi:signal transduction histidine kinase